MQVIETQKTYRGKPTAYARLQQFLAGWDGTPISLSQLRTQLDISPSSWKELRKRSDFHALLEAYQIRPLRQGGKTVWTRSSETSCGVISA